MSDKILNIIEKAKTVTGYYNFGGISAQPDALIAMGDLSLALQEYDKDPDIIILSRKALEEWLIKDLTIGGATQRTYGQNEGQNTIINKILKGEIG